MSRKVKIKFSSVTVKVKGPVTATKKLRAGATMFVIGFLDGDDTFLDLRPVNRWTSNFPQGPCFEQGEIITLPDGDHQVVYLEAIPLFNIQGYSGLKEAIGWSRCVAMSEEVWGFRYFFKPPVNIQD